MTKKNAAMILEWIRPAGIGFAIFFAYYLGKDAVSRFHIMGPFIVMLISGMVAFESLVPGDCIDACDKENPIAFSFLLLARSDGEWNLDSQRELLTNPSGSSVENKCPGMPGARADG